MQEARTVIIFSNCAKNAKLRRWAMVLAGALFKARKNCEVYELTSGNDLLYIEGHLVLSIKELEIDPTDRICLFTGRDETIELLRGWRKVLGLSAKKGRPINASKIICFCSGLTYELMAKISLCVS